MSALESLNIHFLQLNLHWEQARSNRDKIEQMLRDAPPADLILLPEMFSTGFSMKAEQLAETPQGKTFQWMQQMAAEREAAVCGSLITEDQGLYYNRLYFVEPSGDFTTYDKHHLFTLAGEEKVYSPGQKKVSVNYRGWRINLQVCYDLRFPVWCRNDEEFDLQLFVANWPERRSYAWRQLLRARAIENVTYVAGLNRVGPDGNQVDHSGDSALIDPLGEAVAEAEAGREMLFSAEASKENLAKIRKRFAFLKDRDSFSLSE